MGRDQVMQDFEGHTEELMFIPRAMRNNQRVIVCGLEATYSGYSVKADWKGPRRDFE